MLRNPRKEFAPDAELGARTHSGGSRLSFAGLPTCLQDLAETSFYAQHLFFFSPFPCRFPLCQTWHHLVQPLPHLSLGSHESTPPRPAPPLQSPPSCQRDPLKHGSELKGLQRLPKWKLPRDLPAPGPSLVFQSILTTGAGTVLRPQWTARGSLAWQLPCTSTKNTYAMPIRTLHIKVV